MHRARIDAFGSSSNKKVGAVLASQRAGCYEGITMHIFSFLMTFATVWCVVIFIVLPIGVKIPDKVEKGHVASAPENPHLLLKLALSVAIALLIAAAIEWWVAPK